jgi:hypothetical protein
MQQYCNKISPVTTQVARLKGLNPSDCIFSNRLPQKGLTTLSSYDHFSFGNYQFSFSVCQQQPADLSRKTGEIQKTPTARLWPEGKIKS